MTLGLYAQLDGQDGRFDGHRARTQLERGLAMESRKMEVFHELGVVFERWRRRYEGAVQGDRAGGWCSCRRSGMASGAGWVGASAGTLCNRYGR